MRGLVSPKPVVRSPEGWGAKKVKKDRIYIVD